MVLCPVWHGKHIARGSAELHRLELNLDGLINMRDLQYDIAPMQRAAVFAVGENGAEMKAQ